MDFLGTYIADNPSAANGASDEAQDKVDVSHYPAPGGPAQTSSLAAGEMKSSRRRLRDIFLNLRKPDDCTGSHDEDDFDSLPIPTVASDLLTPMAGREGCLFRGDDTSCPPPSSRRSCLDSWRTVHLTPKGEPREDYSRPKEDLTPTQETPKTNDSFKSDVDSGPIQSLFDMFKN